MSTTERFTKFLSNGKVAVKPRDFSSGLCYVGLALFVTILGNVGPSQDAVSRVFEYRGSDLFDGHWWRLLGSPLLQAALWELVVLGPLLLLALGFMQRVIGFWHALWVSHFSSIASTLLIDLSAKALDYEATLQIVDTGCSVALVAVAVIVVIATRSKTLFVVTAVVFAADVIKNRDLASAEHCAALVVAVFLMATVFRRFLRHPYREAI